jgi:hypothetical protein
MIFMQVGHAIEATCAQLLHGECVAVVQYALNSAICFCFISLVQGLVCELSVAAALGHFPFHLLPPLMQLLHTYQLPTHPPLSLPLSPATAALFKDKKNASSSPADGACVSVVLMSHIGRPVARRSLPVPAWLVASTMACSLSVAPPGRPILADIRVPGSKSVSNRALLLAALCPHPVQLSGILHCDDTRVMIQGKSCAPCYRPQPCPYPPAGRALLPFTSRITCFKRLFCGAAHEARSPQLAAAMPPRCDLQFRWQRHGRQRRQVRDVQWMCPSNIDSFEAPVLQALVRQPLQHRRRQQRHVGEVPAGGGGAVAGQLCHDDGCSCCAPRARVTA